MSGTSPLNWATVQFQVTERSCNRRGAANASQALLAWKHGKCMEGFFYCTNVFALFSHCKKCLYLVWNNVHYIT